DVDRERATHAPRVEPQLADARLERGEVSGHHRVPEVAVRHLDLLRADGQDLGVVAGAALEPAFEAVAHAGLRVSRLLDSGERAVAAGLERALRDELPVLVLGSVLAEVPDVAGTILREPLLRVLDDLPRVIRDGRVDDSSRDAVGDQLRLAGHRVDD